MGGAFAASMGRAFALTPGQGQGCEVPACAETTTHSPVLGWGFTLILAFSPQGRRDLSLRGNDEWYAGVVRRLPLALLMEEGGNLRAGLLVLCSEERCVMRIAAVDRKVVAGALVLSALVLLAACSSGDDSFESNDGTVGPAGAAGSDGSREKSAALMVRDGSEEMSAAFAAQGASADSAFAIGALRTTRMIIREGQLSIEVESILEAMEAARAVVEGVGGRVDASRIVGADSDTKYGSVTLRVPSSSFDAVVGELRTLGRLLSESSSSADVTEEYVDLEARRGNLEETEQKLQAFLDKAEDVEDLLAVQRELTTTRGEIERLTGRINLLSALVSESTIAVDFTQPGAEPPITGDGWRPGETLEDAARALVTVLRVVGDVAIVTAVFSPVIVALIVVVWLIRRRWLRSAPRRRASESSTADASSTPDA